MADLTSAEQDQWCEIAATVRAGLAKLAWLVPAMTPEEVASLTTAIDTAMWNEAKARSFDATVERHRAEEEREAAFGG